MSRPTTAELRAVCQPPGTMNRRNGEHWAGRLYMRRISIHVTKVFLALGWSPNSITWLMIVIGLVIGLVAMFGLLDSSVKAGPICHITDT